MESVSKFIEKKLGLKVNMTKSEVSKSNDVKYLGFGFYYDISSHLWKAKPHSKLIEVLKAKLKRLTKRNWSVPWEYRSLKIRQLVVGWINYYKIGNFKKQCQQLDGWIRFRIRMYLWKKWKTVKNRKKQLRKLGVDSKTAWMLANPRKGYARCAKAFLQNVITNSLLKRKGLLSLVDQYQLKHILV